MKSFFKNNKILIIRLVIPLVSLAGISLWISTQYQRDIFVNMATDFISIIITVFYVDWVMKLYNKNKWSTPDLYIRSECGSLGQGFISDIAEHLGLSNSVFPPLDPKNFSVRSTQLEIIQRAKNLQVEDFDKSLMSFNVNQWLKLDEVIESNHDKADKLLELFLIRTSPTELTSLFEFRRRCSDISGTYSLFKYMIGMPLHKLPPLKDGSQNYYGLIAAKRTSIDLKRALDSAINIIETFGFEAKEPDVDYNVEIAKIW